MKPLSSLIIRRKWRSFVRLGYETRKNNRDGLAVWKNSSISLREDNKYGWSKLALELAKNLQRFGLRQDEYNKITQHDKWEEIHFIYQLGAIPTHKNSSTKSLMQIAYNYGSALFICEVKESYDKYLLNEISFSSLNDPLKFINL